MAFVNEAVGGHEGRYGPWAQRQWPWRRVRRRSGDVEPVVRRRRAGGSRRWARRRACDRPAGRCEPLRSATALCSLRQQRATTGALWYIRISSWNSLTFKFSLLARLMGHYCFARDRLSASSVTLPAVGPAGRRARGRSVRRRPGAWALRRPTLHGGPVWLRPVKATPCFQLR